MGKIVGLVVVVLLLVGGFLYWNDQSEEMASEQLVLPGVQKAESIETAGVVSSIKDAMGLGQKMQCTYVLNQDGGVVESKVSVDGGKYRSTTVVGGMTVEALFDGENQYSWTSATKTGMKMSKACLEKMGETVKDMPKPTGETPAPAEVKDMGEAFDMAKNVKCEPAANIDLSLPKDIVFTDQCALMEQSMEMMKEMKDKLPAGMTMPDVSQMMAQ